MFEYLIGYITEVNSDNVVLEVSGVGYVLYVTNSRAYQVDKQHLVKIYVHQVVTDSFQLLYGFKDRSSKLIFEKLIKVSGIGPKNAIAILSGEDPRALLNAIEQGDVAYLTNFPGVGKKTAKQIILDLKGKLSHLELPDGQSVHSAPDRFSKNLTEALKALEALGWQRRSVEPVARQLSHHKGLTVNQYLSAGLKLLHRIP